MARNKSTVYYANTMQDVLFHMKTKQQLQIFGGCSTVKKFPLSSIILSTVPECQNINMHEHFVELGAGVTISQILDFVIEYPKIYKPNKKMLNHLQTKKRG